MLVPVRAAWLALAPLAGPALARALDGRSTPVVVVAAVLAGVGWGVGVVAVLVPRSLGLTALRVLAPLALAAAAASAVATGEVGAAEVAALAAGALVAGLALFVASVSDAFVDGSSYGPERRFALRVPVGLLAGPVEVAWVAVAAPALAGPLLLAAGAWVPGAVLVAVGVAAGRPALRALHQLARRWVVFVPAGVVVHDPLALADPVLFPRRLVRALRPAEVGDDIGAVDLSRGAPGLALALELTDPAPVGLIRGRAATEAVETNRLLFTPGRPGAVLTEARTRHLA